MQAKLVLPLMAVIAVAGMAGIYMAASDGGTQSQTDDNGDPIVQDPTQEVKDATLTVNAIDVSGDSSTSVTDVASTIWKASSSDAYGTRLKTDSDIGGLSVSSGLSSNDAYTIVETDAGYYTAAEGRADGEVVSQPMKSVAIGSTQPVAEYHVKTVVSESDMSISAYDERNNALTTGTSGEEDFEVTMSSDDTKRISVEFENTNDNAVYHAAGLAYKPLNDIDGADIVSVTGPDGEVSTSSATVPEHLQTDIDMHDDNSTAENVSDYQSLVEFAEVIELEGNEKIVLEIDLESDQTNDPSAVDSGDRTKTDAFVAQFKDADHYTTPNLASGYGMHDESTSQSDVGLDESDSSPYGSETGFIVEAK